MTEKEAPDIETINEETMTAELIRTAEPATPFNYSALPFGGRPARNRLGQ